MAKFIRSITIWIHGKERKRGVIECSCGEELVCSNFTNTCSCGRDYNMSGCLLAPRPCWGEDTGEHFTDILLVDQVS